MIAATLVIWSVLLWSAAIGYGVVALLFLLASAIDEPEPLDWTGFLISIGTAIAWPASMAVSLLAAFSARPGSEPV